MLHEEWTYPPEYHPGITEIVHVNSPGLLVYVSAILGLQVFGFGEFMMLMSRTTGKSMV
jgi:hypothetical protein